MADRFLCALAQFDAGTQARLDVTRRALLEQGYVGSQTPGLPHHITLASFPCDQEEELRRRLRDVCHATRQFSIVFTSIGLFGLEVIFLAPAASQQLLNLKNDVEGAPDVDPLWVPHATMLVDKPEAVRHALPLVAGSFSRFSGTVASVSLYEFWPKRFLAEERLLPPQA